VIGDPLGAIASGPLSPAAGSFADAVAALRETGLWEAAPASVRRRLEDGRAGRIAENPAAGDPAFARVRLLVVGNAETAAHAVARAAHARGYEAQVTTLALAGEAREAGGALGVRARALADGAWNGAQDGRGIALVSAGETTVTVRGAGRGGRNQEFVLAGALAIDGAARVALGSLGTDGVDGPTDAAGAVATGASAARARALGRDPQALLEDNDAYRFFEPLGDLIRTGPTGTNVMDLQIALIRAQA